MKRKAKKQAPGRRAAPEGRVKFTTTLPPQTVLDLNILAVEDGHGSSGVIIAKLVKAAMDRRSHNQGNKS
jgi:hypothetical protein